MVQVAYEIAEADGAVFNALMADLAAARRRNGGYGWSLMQDLEDPKRFVETWFETSWLQHLRHHDHVTAADRATQDQVHALHQGSEPPRVRHLLSAT